MDARKDGQPNFSKRSYNKYSYFTGLLVLCIAVMFGETTFTRCLFIDTRTGTVMCKSQGIFGKFHVSL